MCKQNRACHDRGRAAGFTLVEVTLAILLISVGVLSLFSLFPSGLKQSDDALLDTHLALFSGRILQGITAEASAVTNWDTWADIASFRHQIENVPVEVGGANLHADGGDHTVDDAIRSDVAITYKLTVDEVAGHEALRYAALKVCLGDHWDEENSQWFYTEFFYRGEP